MFLRYPSVFPRQVIYFQRKWCSLNKVVNVKDFSRPNKKIKYFSRTLTKFRDFSRRLDLLRLYEPCEGYTRLCVALSRRLEALKFDDVWWKWLHPFKQGPPAQALIFRFSEVIELAVWRKSFNKFTELFYKILYDREFWLSYIVQNKARKFSSKLQEMTDLGVAVSLDSVFPPSMTSLMWGHCSVNEWHNRPTSRTLWITITST